MKIRITRALIACTISLTFLNDIFIQQSHAIESELDTAFVSDGTAEYASAGNATALRTFNAITIEAWIKPAVTCVGNIAAKLYDYAIYCSAGEVAYALAGTSTSWIGVSTGAAITPNEWHHVAISRAASTNVTKFYLDGQLTFTGDADNAGTAAIKNSANTFLNIGARGQSSTYFNGAIDEVRIFNISRTEAQIESDMHTWGNLGLSSVVGYYDFNSVFGSTIENKAYSPDANSDLAITGGITFSAIETTSAIGDQRVTTFPRSYLTSVGGWLPPSGVSRTRALVIAGGGGGGYDEGGGGGAGGFIDNSALNFTADEPLEIVVGQGGFGSIGDAYTGSNGQDSSVGGLIAIGGGGGATSSNVNNAAVRTGLSGGSGGGGAGEGYTPHTAGSGTSGQGFAGGAGIASGAGGGGGGALEAGNTDGDSLGGDGRTSNITGSTLTYAGGGGGGNGNTSSTTFGSGLGGGGTGGATGTKPLAGTVNTGSGGGGGGGVAAGYLSVVAAGASGGSGVIILRYAIASRVYISNLSYSIPPKKGINTTITFNTNAAGSVQVFAQGARIKNCFKKIASGTSPNYSVSCVWKPAVHGQAILKIVATPNDSLISTSTQSYQVHVLRRTTTR